MRVNRDKFVKYHTLRRKLTMGIATAATAVDCIRLTVNRLHYELFYSGSDPGTDTLSACHPTGDVPFYHRSEMWKE